MVSGRGTRLAVAHPGLETGVELRLGVRIASIRLAVRAFGRFRVTLWRRGWKERPRHLRL